ncbi:MAG TPA: regulatory protein GemA [Desulfobulbus sp.]|nr:regulatory protein GemA [Desulfobulbus sp.]
MGLDRKKLAVIHIVKRELGLSDEEYRDILEQVTGVRSARDLDEAGFRRLMRRFARSRHYRSSRDGITFRQKLYIRHLVRDLGWDERHFTNFLKKYYHQDTIDTMSRKEAGKLIESLKNILRRHTADR